MTATIPGFLAWPLLAFMAAVLTVRYMCFNASLYETYLNHALALALVCNLLREKAIEEFLARNHIMTVTTAQELSYVAMILLTAEFTGFLTLLSRVSPQETRRRHRYHRLVAIIVAAGFFIAASRARAAGQILEVSRGWDIVLAWLFFALFPIVLSVQLIGMGFKEWRRPNAKRRERLIAACGMTLGVSIASTTLNILLFLAIFEQIGWFECNNFLLALHGCHCFWNSVVCNVLAALPAARTLSARVGLDATSRGWRALQGLRDALTAAVPESLFEIKSVLGTRQKTALELHQTVVQIRDAILFLRPYFREIHPAAAAQFFHRYSVPIRQRDVAIQALQIAAAVRAKATGARPEPVDAAMIRRSRATTLDEERAELMLLSKWWPSAQAAIYESAPERFAQVGNSL